MGLLKGNNVWTTTQDILVFMICSHQWTDYTAVASGKLHCQPWQHSIPVVLQHQHRLNVVFQEAVLLVADSRAHQ